MLARPPRIVHVTESLAAGTLGFLVQATRELAAAGVEQHLLFAQREDTPPGFRALFDTRVKLHELTAPRESLPGFVRDLRAALREQVQHPRCHAIHLHSSRAGFVGRLLLAPVRPRPRIYYSPHGLSFLNRRLLLPSLVFRSLEWLAAHVDATLVGCSESEAALLGQLSGAPAAVLENPVDPAFLALRRVRSAQPVVVAIGRICRQKAPERFAALAARFRIAEHGARFVWVGAGDADRTAELRAAGVEVTGWVDTAQVRQVLAGATVLVQTSRWEGMPLSVLQALAAGVPCVVTDVVGNRDAVRHGITGYVTRGFTEMLVGLTRLLDDAALHARFSEAARRDAAERFGPESFRRRLLALYQLEEATIRPPAPQLARAQPQPAALPAPGQPAVPHPAPVLRLSLAKELARGTPP